MRPNWRKMLLGGSVVVSAFLALVIFDSRFRVIKLFQSLPEGQAQALGIGITLVVMGVCSLLGSLLAQRKNRPLLKWMLLCFLFNVWALIVLWSLPEMEGNLEDVP